MTIMGVSSPLVTSITITMANKSKNKDGVIAAATAAIIMVVVIGVVANRGEVCTHVLIPIYQITVTTAASVGQVRLLQLPLLLPIGLIVIPQLSLLTPLQQIM